MTDQHWDRVVDVVIVDSTALSNGSSALLVSSLADTTVLVVPAGSDSVRTVRALRTLKTAGIVVGGLVINNAASRRNVVSLVTDHHRSTADAGKRSENPIDTPSIVGM